MHDVIIAVKDACIDAADIDIWVTQKYNKSLNTSRCYKNKTYLVSTVGIFVI
ncbi:hypothetical protein GCM10023116_19550 [Kistimonas scapharcae]|uniref:Uncharacterized protein n=1 Tax=Kistimonas scapharcae TaxID=1036133 RepID=A0ABP8V182_9GAMM